MTKDEALDRKAENARELGLDYEPEQEPCGGCGGSGWVPRDPDIGTSQECFVCGGSGEYLKEPEPYKVISDHITQTTGGRAYVDPVTGNVSVGTPQRKPLTDEEIYDMYNEPRSDAEMIAFARAIEAKLKEKNT